jgi:hypothetical protein
LFFSKAKKELPRSLFSAKKKYNNPSKGFLLLSGLGISAIKRDVINHFIKISKVKKISNFDK